ncbi:MAG: hypothetical protein ACOYM3_01700 [Terrimicrobiaceae bacterium]
MTKIATVGLAIGLPPLGAGTAGRPISAYLEFPPLTRYVDHAGFSRVVFVLMAAPVLCVYLPLAEDFSQVRGGA